MSMSIPLPRDRRDAQHLRLRDSSKDKHNGNQTAPTIIVIVVVAVVSLVLVAIAWFVVLRRKRATRRDSQQSSPVKQKPGLLNRLLHRGSEYQRTPNDDGEQGRSQELSSAPPSTANTTNTADTNRTTRSGRQANGNSTTNRESAATTVDRNTSIRSIMTLPPYRQTAIHTEQVLGREGERDGVDVIVDLPTAEEEEEMRNDEMETMYQIRVERRRQLAEREARRTERREARARNDAEALREIRARTREAEQDTTVDDLRQNVNQIKDTRNRSVSSVSYMGVGMARHDGTRIRANSTESERVGLLSDAASISATHQRGRSAGSIASNDGDMDTLSMTMTRSRGNSDAGLSRLETNSQDNLRRMASTPEPRESDLGDEAMPPPEYEDIPLDETQRSTTPLYEPPPDYSGPYRTASMRSERDISSRQAPHVTETETSTPSSGAPTPTISTDGIPRLPSLRVPQLPEIIIEPSSAHPDDHEPSSLSAGEQASTGQSRS